MTSANKKQKLSDQTLQLIIKSRKHKRIKSGNVQNSFNDGITSGRIPLVIMSSIALILALIAIF